MKLQDTENPVTTKKYYLTSGTKQGMVSWTQRVLEVCMQTPGNEEGKIGYR